MKAPEILMVVGVLLILALLMMDIAEPSVPIDTIIYEAASEPLEAQIWVACVIQNRSSERGMSFDEVCAQPFQFSCNNPGYPHRRYSPDELTVAETAWEMAFNYCQYVHANMYHDISVTPYWTKSKKVKFIKQIGKLRFYKEAK